MDQGERDNVGSSVGSAMSTPRLSSAAFPWILAVAGVVVYANSLRVPFVFDDNTHIVGSRAIEKLWPPWELLIGRQRPVVAYSLAVNYALGQRRVMGYHVANVAIHVSAALVLFGLLRRILAARAAGDLSRRTGWSDGATLVAFAASLIWLVHPLQTQAVTYVIQRSESLMGLFYLLTLYCVARTAEGRRPALWGGAAVAACAAGMGTKEVMATAPLVALLCDRTFYAGSLREALRRRWPLYVGLAATWGLLAAIVGYDRLFVHQGTAGFGAQGIHTVNWWQYARSQPAVLLHYLRLALWPHPLCFDYGWPAATSWSAGVLLPSAVIGLLLVAGLFALWRSSPLGLAAIGFFLVLAPSSSIVPIADLAVEHRMYLALVPIVATGVALAAHGLGWFGEKGRMAAVYLLVAVACVLGFLSIRRNFDYRSEKALWASVVRRAPLYYRGHNNLARQLFDEGDFDRAIQHYRISLALKPDIASSYYNLGRALLGASAANQRTAQQRGPLNPRLEAKHLGEDQLDQAIEQFREALNLDPELAKAESDLGAALATQGKLQQAIDCYRRAIELNPRSAKTYTNLGVALVRTHQLEQGLVFMRRAIALRPDYADGHHNLATALRMAGRVSEASEHEELARRLGRRGRSADR